MHSAFSFGNYVIKPQGLSIGGKYRAHNPQNQPTLFIEHKTAWKTLSSTYHVYGNEKKQQEVMTLQQGKHDDFPDYHDVIDLTTGEKVGGVGADWKNFLADAWGITDAHGAIIGRVREKSTRRTFLHEFTASVVPQVLTITVDGQPVAELRQKSVLIGHHLLIDFGMDLAGILDRRLGLATAVIVAMHQGSTDTD